MKESVAALVPMRHASVRVKGKNYRDFNGKPLFYWILSSLVESRYIKSVYIDTDSPVIMREAPKIHSKIKIIKRPAELCADTVPMNDIIMNDIRQIDSEYFIQTHSTNPLLKTKTIDNALQTFFKNDGYDSLFSVTKHQARFWDAQSRPINHNPSELIRTQDLLPVYEENSNLYIFRKSVFLECRHRIGRKPLMYEISKLESIDIDEETDFKLAEIASKRGIVS